MVTSCEGCRSRIARMLSLISLCDACKCACIIAGARRASSIMRWFNGVSLHIHLFQTSLRVQNDDIGESPDLQTPTIFETQIIGWVLGQATDGIVQLKSDFQ